MNKAVLMFILISSVCACGVKGRPLSPQEPAFIGTGEPNFLNNKKDEKKTNPKR